MKREPVEVISIKIKCPTTKKTFLVTLGQLSFHGWEAECSTCGSHSGVDMDIGMCPSCKKTHPVTILSSF